MNKIGIISKLHNIDAKDILHKLIPWLSDHGKEIFLDKDSASVIDESSAYQKSEIPSLADIIIVLGGDGTLLSAARLVLVNGRDVPILGINLGGLGFLTEGTLEELYPTLEDILNNDFITEDRQLLISEVYRQGERIARSYSLNDVIIRRLPARMINVEIFINKRYVTSLRGDGLIISTPTGSTAYSLSAGGPIIYPSVGCMIVTPICPHTLANRPIVIPDNVTVEIILKSKDEDSFVSFDGQVGFSLRQEDIVEIKKSPDGIRLITSKERNYYDILRKKLKWGEG
ncbi:MAG: NAD(+)/NADH kinase [Nitrospirota bacterium]